MPPAGGTVRLLGHLGRPEQLTLAQRRVDLGGRGRAEAVAVVDGDLEQSAAEPVDAPAPFGHGPGFYPRRADQPSSWLSSSRSDLLANPRLQIAYIVASPSATPKPNTNSNAICLSPFAAAAVRLRWSRPLGVLSAARIRACRAAAACRRGSRCPRPRAQHAQAIEYDHTTTAATASRQRAHSDQSLTLGVVKSFGPVDGSVPYIVVGAFSYYRHTLGPGPAYTGFARSPGVGGGLRLWSESRRWFIAPEARVRIAGDFTASVAVGLGL